MDPAYEGAGSEEGLTIWRIENFEVVPYAKEKYGQFYEGDSYIVLYTKDGGRGTLSWDIHFWLGSETSQDESGTAAIKSVELDDQLGGVPVQHREVQGHESALFLSRFRGGVRYLKGGVKSGFTHVDPDAPYPARLFHVKGRRNVRVKEVEVGIGSMNKTDCFILDGGAQVWVYMGPSSRRMERLKAIQAANGIRDNDHAGKSKIVIIDETADGGEVEGFFEALGGGSPDEVSDEEQAEDAEFERSQEKSVTLHRVKEDDSGSIDVELVSERPFTHDMLNSDDCFILDAAGAGIFVWIGRESSKKEKVRSMQMATNYLEQKGYPKWTKVERVIEDGEPTVFKQYFRTWEEPQEAIGFGRVYSANQIAASAPEGDFDVSSLHAEKRRLLAKSGGKAFGFMPDDGSGKIEMFRIENFELEPNDEAAHGMLFGGDSYVLRYTYEKGGLEKIIIYFWQGNESSQDERAAAAIHTIKLDDEVGGKAVQVRVTQGHEPAHFLQIFKGRMVIFSGGHASGFRNVHDHDSYDADGTRLFQVRGTSELDMRAQQKPEVAASLNSDDVFVLETPGATFLWIGKDASEDEKSMGEKVVELVSPGRDVTQIAEGEEDDTFWDALGGQGEYASGYPISPLLAPRLFHCIITGSGRLRVSEVAHFTQEDLCEDDVMVADSGDEVYVWVGQGATDEEKAKAGEMAQEYIKTDPTERTLDTTVIITVRQGEEPRAFKTLFPSWNPDLWQELPTYDDIKAQIVEANSALE